MEVLTTTAFRHTDLGEWSAEASDLGLKPGDWPLFLAASIDGEDTLLQRGHVVTDREGDVQCVEYKPLSGQSKSRARFTVWND